MSEYVNTNVNTGPGHWQLQAQQLSMTIIHIPNLSNIQECQHYLLLEIVLASVPNFWIGESLIGSRWNFLSIKFLIQK